MKKSGKTIFLGGINGVGKTSILLNLNKSDPNMTLIHGSKSFMDYLGIKNYNYQILTSMPEEKIRHELKSFIHSTIAANSDRLCVMDGHFVNIINLRPEPWVDEWINQFDLLIHLKSNPESIYLRQLHDNKERLMYPTKMSKPEMIDAIDHCQKVSIKTMQSLSKRYNIPCKIIVHDRGIISTTKKIKMVIKELL